MIASAGAGKPIRIALIAGEPSGDELGAHLMPALRRATDGRAAFSGVGGPAMTRAGLSSLFPMSDIAVMGFLPVLARLPTLLERIRQTADAIVAFAPHLVIAIDSPDFTHRVARRVRRRAPDVAIVDYVSPTVWAWRPGRARAMVGTFDRVLALLPFEPAAHRRLGGPDCVYVGHPLIERLGELRAPEGADIERKTLLVLPGSRRSEISRLMAPFGETAARVARIFGDLDIVLPAVPHLADEIASLAKTWPKPPRIVKGEAAKFAAFRSARAALAASGTVTLELALARVPTIVAYRVSRVEEAIVRALATAPSIVLPNLILGEPVMPAFVQGDCAPDRLAPALEALVRDGSARQAQLTGFAQLDALMRLPRDARPSEAAAAAALAMLKP